MKRLACVVIALAVAPLVACGGGGGSSNTSGIPDECNPLGGQGCLLPWPSMTYTKADSTSATGFRLDLPPEGMPINTDPTPLDPTPLNRWDGFSPSGPILAAFPAGVSVTNLPPFTDPAQSLGSDSPIILLDMATGERAPFFAEIDVNETVPAHQDLIIRPLERLHPNTRYAVAIRNTVKGADGSALPVPAAFAAIVAGTAFDHPRFAALAARYDDIFAALQTAGVDKTELVLAWDYVTASDTFLQGDMTTMRAAALPAIGANGANLSFTATAGSGSDNGAYVTYTGTFKSPNFLTDGEADDSILARDSNGAPKMSGLRDATYAAYVPACITQPGMTLPRPTVIFGHGLFGSAVSYLSDAFLDQLANQYCFVIIAGNWIGLTDADIPLAALAVNNLNNGAEITEKLGQALIDFIALEQAARGPMATSPQFQYQGQPVIDTTKIYYVGGSLGGIMGNAFMAYDPTITRGVLAVPGGVWSLLLERSNAWFDLIGTVQSSYTDPSVYSLLVSFLGMSFEPFDPVTTAEHVVSDPLFGQPAKNILMWYSQGDCLVTNISTEFIAREMGLSMLTPSVVTPFGIPGAPGPLENGIVAFDDHPTPLPPTTNQPPPTDNGTHEGINQKPAALRFVNDFLISGSMITDECRDGSDAVACDCQGSGSPCQ